MSLDAPPWPSKDLHDLLDAGERERAARFHFALHRLRFVHGRGLLRRMLGHGTGIAPAAIRFDHGAQGKPRLADQTSVQGGGLDFNLSHSGPLALLALSDGAQIGVDIELPREMPDLLAIARRNFAPAEFRAMTAWPEHSRADAFLACWTRKEAFVKALGSGLSMPLADFEVSLDPDGPAQLRHVADPAHPISDFTVWAGRVPGGGLAATIVRRPGASVSRFSLV